MKTQGRFISTTGLLRRATERTRESSCVEKGNAIAANVRFNDTCIRVKYASGPENANTQNTAMGAMQMQMSVSTIHLSVSNKQVALKSRVPNSRSVVDEKFPITNSPNFHDAPLCLAVNP